MKKITLATVMLLSFISVGVYAQTTQGQKMIGGSFSISSTSYDNNASGEYSSFTIAPSFGYFIKDNVVVGASVSFSTNSSGTGTAKATTSSFGVGPFARIYKFTSNDRFAFFAQGAVAIQSSQSKSSTDVVTSKSTSLGLRVSPGFAYFFNEHWAGELSLTGISFSSNKETEPVKNKSTTVTFDVNSLIPYIGLRYHF